MATIIETESFVGVATIAQLAGAADSTLTTKWRTNGSIPSTKFGLDNTGGESGQRLKVTGTTSTGGSSGVYALIMNLGSGLTTVVMGVKYTPAVVDGTQVPILHFRPSTSIGSTDFTLLQVGGELAIFNGGTQRSITSGLGLVAATRYAIEVKMVFVSGSTWTITVRVDGVAVIGPGNFLLSTNTVQYVCLGCGINSGSQLVRNGDLWEEVYVASDDFIAGGGSWRVQVIRGSAAGAHTDWVPDSGSNYARVNEQNVDDTSYVQATNDGDEDTYEQDNPTHISGHSVRAINRCSRAAYLAGAKHLAHVIRNGSGTELAGADKALAASLGYIGTTFNTQADGSAWGSFNDVDAYQLGYKQKA